MASTPPFDELQGSARLALDERKHEDGDAGRFRDALASVVGRRLTYKDLIGVGAAEAPEAAPTAG